MLTTCPVPTLALSAETSRYAGADAQPLLSLTGLQPHVLGLIWDLADTTKVGRLTKEQFAVFMKLVSLVQQGFALPPTLPLNWVPPAFRAAAAAAPGAVAASGYGGPAPAAVGTGDPEIDELNQKIAAQRAKLADATGQVGDYEKDIEELRTRRALADSDLRQAELEKENADQRLDEIKASLDRDRNEAADLEAEADRQTRELDNLAKQAEEAQERIRRAEEERSKQQVLSAAEQEFGQLNRQIRVRGCGLRATAGAAVVLTKCAAARGAFAAGPARRQDLQEGLAKLREELNAVTQEKQQLEAQLASDRRSSQTGLVRAASLMENGGATDTWTALVLDARARARRRPGARRRPTALTRARSAPRPLRPTLPRRSTARTLSTTPLAAPRVRSAGRPAAAAAVRRASVWTMHSVGRHYRPARCLRRRGQTGSTRAIRSVRPTAGRRRRPRTPSPIRSPPPTRSACRRTLRPRRCAPLRPRARRCRPRR